MNFDEQRKSLIDKLISRSYVSTPEVISAMSKVPREAFVPPELKSNAYVDNPLPIGSGQTISAPHMVAIMTEALDVRKDVKILEIGTGSGYQAAILAEMATDGFVYTMETVDELASRAEERLINQGYDNVFVIAGDGTKGYEKEAPYDRIIVTCGAPRIPKALVKQLTDPGRLLVPVGGRSYQDLISVEKNEGKITEDNLGGCVFVPLVGEDGW